MKNKKRQFKDTAKLKNIIFYIFAFVIFFVPLIVKLKVLTVPDYVMKYYPADKTFDFFTYYKAMLLIMGTTVIFPLVVYYRYKIGNKIKFDLVAKLHLAFGASILLSTLLSSYKQVAFFGFFNKNEGALTWWAYLLLSYSIYIFVESKAEVTKFVKVIVASTTTISVIGLFQFMGLDYIKFDWIQRLVYGPYYAQIKQSGVTMMFPERTVYSTVANPNYIGSVMALAIPLILYLFMESKNRQEKLITGCLAFLHLFILVASKSTAGLLAVGVTMAGYFSFRIFKKNRQKLVIYSLLGTVLIIAVFGLSGVANTQFSKIKTQLNYSNQNENPFKKIEIDGTKFIATDQSGESIVVNHNGKNIWVEDSEGKIIGARIDREGWIYRSESWLVNYQAQQNLLMIYIRDVKTQNVTVKKVNIIPEGYTIFGELLVPEQLKVKKVSLIGNEVALSGRGYIWNRTIPMIGSKPILGYGADVFVLDFPQNDLLDKEIYNLITDKPHSLYFQTLVSFGLFGFCLFVTLIVLVIRKNRSIELSTSMGAYFIAGVANDSTVYLGMLIFVLIGLLNSNCVEDRNEL